MISSITRVVAGHVGNSKPIGTIICQLQNPSPGRWRVRGVVRHTSEDGCRLVIGGAVVMSRIPQQAGTTSDFGPFVVDINNRVSDVVLQLAIATGSSGTASGCLYLENLQGQ
jgi:hypothetical protein